MLVRFNDVSKSFGVLDLFHDVSFELQAGQKVGLIGPNGSGKTTLLRLFEIPDEADTGTVARRSGLRIGRLEQIPDLGDATVFEVAVESFAALATAEDKIAELEAAISNHPTDAALLEAYSTLQHEFEFRGGYTYRARTEAALFGVGFTRDLFSRQALSLSGGEKNRLALACLLLADVDLLLLDEPTNHLDIRAIEWLEHFLSDTGKAIVMVSHDRLFLDRVVSRILEIDGRRVTAYSGNYSAFLEQRKQRRALQEKEWRHQQEHIERTEDFIRRNLAGQKTKQAQSRRTQLQRMKRIERPATEDSGVRFQFDSSIRAGRYVMTARDLAIGYLDNRITEHLNLSVERGQRWALLGPNGSGKTTLLRTCIGRLAPLEGDLTWDERIEIGYYDQQLDDLSPSATVIEELRTIDSRATDGALRSFLAQFLFRGEDAFKDVGSLSGGEKSRLALAKIIYKGPPLLALDEPTNHLDIAAREALESALMEYPGTMIFVTHDRRLVERIATHILYIGDEGVCTFEHFDSFERWLGETIDGTPVETKSHQSAISPNTPTPQLSKNKREQVEHAVRTIESRIENDEEELRRIEQLFQGAPSGLDWNETNRRYSNIKDEIESLYEELSKHLRKLD